MKSGGTWALALAAVTAMAATTGCGARLAQRDLNLVALTAALGNRFVPADAPSPVVARLRIETAPRDPHQRAPINVVLVVDTSGSMEGAAIADARAACLQLLESLASGDYVSLVVFHSRAEVLVPPTALNGQNLAELRRQVGTMRAAGTTALTEGLRLGIAQAAVHHLRDGVNRVVLLSDGVPNDARDIELLAQAAGQSGTTVTALGLGLEYDPALMGAIAQRSGGRFRYIERSSDVAAIFREEILRVRRVVARGASVTLTPGPGVTIEDVLGRIATRNSDDTRVTVNLGELAEGEPRELIVRLTAAPHRAGAAVELIDAVLTFDDAAGGAGQLERRVFLGARATADDHELTQGRNEDVQRSAAQIQVAAGVVDAVRVAREQGVAQAQSVLDRASADAEAYVAPTDSTQLSTLRQRVSALRQALPATSTARGVTPPRAPSVSAAPTTTAPPTAEYARPGEPTPAPSPTLQSIHSDAMGALY